MHILIRFKHNFKRDGTDLTLGITQEMGSYNTKRMSETEKNKQVTAQSTRSFSEVA